MTYEESAQLITDMQFRGRVKVAVLTMASRILGAGGGNSTSAFRWATQAFQNADQVAAAVQGPAVMEPGVQSLGASIDDGGLQFAVDNAVNKML